MTSRPLRLLGVAVPAAVLTAALMGPLVVGRPPAAGAGTVPGAGTGSIQGGPVVERVVREPAGPAARLDPAASRLRRGEVLTPRPVASLTDYVWPLSRGRLTQPFGPSAGNSLLVGGVETHDGVDLATFCGDRIVAAHDGIVLAAGRDYHAAIGWRGDPAPYVAWLDAHHGWADLPITVVIDDGDTYRSVYAHFSRIVVSAGERVRAGQLLGYEGRTGHATGCHLHFGLFSPLETARWVVRADVVARYDLPAAETARVDPLAVLPPRPSGPVPVPARRSEPGWGRRAL